LGALDQAILASGGLLIAVMVARTGGPSALGLLAPVQSGLMFLSQLLKASFGDPLVVEARANGRAKDLGIASPIVIALVGLGFSTAALWAFGGRFLARSPRPSIIVLALVVLLPLSCLQDLARALRLAGMGERSMLIGDISVTIVRLSVLALTAGPVGMHGLWVGLAAMGVGGLASLLSIRSFLRRTRSIERLRRIWRLGRWLVVDVLLSGFMIYGIWLLFVPKAGFEVAGQMRACQQLFAPAQTAILGLNVVLLSRFAGYQNHTWHYVRRSGFLQIVLVGFWGLLVVGVGPTAAGLVFGAGFQIPRHELAALTAAVMATTAFELTAVHLRANRDMRRLLTARLTVTLIGLSGVLLLATSVARLALIILLSYLGGLVASWASGWRRKRFDSLRHESFTSSSHRSSS